jgi:hypothetical protein
MSAKQENGRRFSAGARVLRLLGSRKGQWLIASLVLVALVAIGWSALWQNVRDHVVASEDYRLNPHAIELVPSPPPWIHSDLKAQVIRDGSLEGSLSILDSDLTVRLARAFRLHPWVAGVSRVSKRHPAGATVELSYREPVAMVKVTGGVLPVDAEGLLLPSEDFSVSDVPNYPLIGGVTTSPAGLTAGTRWGDPGVAAGSRLAALLAPHWKKLNLERISVEVAPHESIQPTFDLLTQMGKRIHWGLAPGSSGLGASTRQSKLARLLEYAGASGLDSSPDESLDLRGEEELVAVPPRPRQASPRGPGTPGRFHRRPTV